MASKDQELIETLAIHMADEMGVLGHHEERWYSIAQRRKYVSRAKNIVILMRNAGFVFERRPANRRRAA